MGEACLGGGGEWVNPRYQACRGLLDDDAGAADEEGA